MVEMPSIDTTKCDGCGLCVGVCKCQAIVMAGDIVSIVQKDECGWCLECEAVCPLGAISCAYEIVVEESDQD